MAPRLTITLLFLLIAWPTHAATPTSIALTWIAPGDDGVVGTAAQYDLRYSPSPITAANFSSAPRWLATPTPTVSGTQQGCTVTGLSPATTYYFALKAADEVPNWSAMSLVLIATTPSNTVGIPRIWDELMHPTMPGTVTPPPETP